MRSSERHDAQVECAMEKLGDFEDRESTNQEVTGVADKRRTDTVNKSSNHAVMG